MKNNINNKKVKLFHTTLLSSMVLIILVGTIFSNCSYNLYYSGNWYDIKIPQELVEEFKIRNENTNITTEDNIKFIINWVYNNIEGIITNETRPVQEILDAGWGDCTSRSYSALALIYKIIGIKGYLCVGQEHTFIYVNNKYYWDKIEGNTCVCLRMIHFDDIQKQYMCFQ